MEIHELVIEMKLLERRLTLYEEKYGVLSEDFYKALLAAKSHSSILAVSPITVMELTVGCRKGYTRDNEREKYLQIQGPKPKLSDRELIMRFASP
jgi:hypothetical protein